VFDNRYLYSASRTKVLETQLLDRTIVERMVAAQSAQEAYAVLSETIYSSLMLDAQNYIDYEKLIFLELLRTKTYIDAISPEKELTALFFLKYDSHNIKVLLKSMLLKTVNDHLCIDAGTIPLETLKEMLQSKDLRGLNPEMARCVTFILAEFKNQPNVKRIDWLMDQALYEAMFKRSKKSKSPYATDLISTQIDLINIKTLMRLKLSEAGRDSLSEVMIKNGKINLNFYEEIYDAPLSTLPIKLMVYGYDVLLQKSLEGFESFKSFVPYEKLADDLIFEKIKQAKYVAFGIEPLIGYILAKENEAKIIRMIMVAKINQISDEAIRERLGAVYV
jgi:V/A-type H+-transporting ATPase subunit C